ncbi:MAG: DUF5678 domain-containing protein [candidate division WOR-3 bacterium]|nr:DUF5678 domain-containing protein [candidate division WOR-3 bacterium]
MKIKSQTQRTLSLLLSGRGSKAHKYAGKHVLVVNDKVVPLKARHEEMWRDIEALRKKYGEMPVVTFVPRPGLSYILCGW